MTFRRRAPVAYILAAAVAGVVVGQLLGLTGAVADHHNTEARVKRIGMVVGINPNRIEAYEKLHADNYPGVRDLLSRANMKNFSIFKRQLDDGKTYLFGYYEYVGEDFDADMAWLSAQPRNTEWLQVTDPMQIPLKGETGWAEMKEVYHND